MIRPLDDAEMAELSAEQARSYLDGYRRLVAEVTRGLNAAWALANVPGTGLALVRGQIVAFARDTGHARPRGAAAQSRPEPRPEARPEQGRGAVSP